MRRRRLGGRTANGGGRTRFGQSNDNETLVGYPFSGGDPFGGNSAGGMGTPLAIVQTGEQVFFSVSSRDDRVRTITVDNGTEFHDYAALERATDTRFYFATPHHAWERGTNENTNGLIRQYLPKGCSMARLTQHDCNAIARTLNQRPRKRLGYRTPEECYAP